MFNSLALFTAMNIGQIAIYVVVAAAVIALVYVALKQFGIAIPGWVAQILWIIVVCFVVVCAIRLVMSM